jgi:hypothetical protein
MRLALPLHLLSCSLCFGLIFVVGFCCERCLSALGDRVLPWSRLSPLHDAGARYDGEHRRERS